MEVAEDNVRLALASIDEPACVSSGARASELLGVQLGDVEWTKGQLWVISKGTRLRQAVPVSPEALAYLAGYLEEAGLPAGCNPVWRTRRGEPKPLSYWAARRILQRADEQLGTNWTLHDLRHTAATRMARDPALTLLEVQTILRHAHLSTTALYTAVRLDDLLDQLAEHYPAADRTGPVVSDVRRRRHCGGLR
ncbi:tyrosine-type recombinase/integrase [Streptomyces sp. R35]|uniref:Tyrosine-type recombinase/integrase n=1 Tax=Streptomyces sp. R35 TaxID=3238630 RepID=A0AB39SNA1_9ACTN